MLTVQEADETLAAAEQIYTEPQVSNAIDGMAEAIVSDYASLNPLVLCVMKGGLYITAALMQRLQFAMDFDYLQVGRYRDNTAGGVFEWLVKPVTSLANRNILIVDDILDEGITMNEIVSYCLAQDVASVRVAVLTRKQHDRLQVDVDIAYVGLELPDRYVFGCGMDYKGYFRNLNAIYALAEDAQQ